MPNATRATAAGLIKAISRGRHVEWVAQGLFVYSVNSFPSFRARLQEALGRPGVHQSDWNDEWVATEVPVKQTRWRADVVIENLAEDAVNIELKICASISDAQLEAATAGKMHLLVSPTSYCPPKELEPIRRLSWTGLGEAVRSDAPYIAALFEELDAYAPTWTCPELHRDDYDSELNAYCNSGSPAVQIEHFLNAVHLQLADQLVERKYIGGAWAQSGPKRYFGYNFTVGLERSSAYWIGFELTQDSGEWQMRLTDPEGNTEFWASNKERLFADAVGKQVVANLPRPR